MATRILIYDRAKQANVPILPEAASLLDSSNSPWLNLKLQHFRVGESERNEAILSSCLTAVCLAEPTRRNICQAREPADSTPLSGLAMLRFSGPGIFLRVAPAGKLSAWCWNLPPSTCPGQQTNWPPVGLSN